ncbi:PSP1 domain-containing protein [Desulfovibrio ferrophilus]|uniref:PSP1 domain-containing protein n=1 Tax=Desulfovibrio ferrophilus TaxID=241368 RepID=A0A2Z6AV09_9BACT|nr:regulatory iron-sulfur-containing complex subunit RicT [Desulfovibrio ferrophilus]BBD07064.1 PSP1 domain-containing protein [Desulfovibrio ferrophilus]
MSHVLGLKFSDYGQIYYFDSGAFVVCKEDRVIVKTEQGMGLGTVVTVHEECPESVGEEELKSIFRLATEEDLAAETENLKLAREAYSFCRECVRDRELEMKLVDVEVFFDRGKMIFYFTAPGRIDFRELVKDLVKTYRTRIELRQIGVRHETQMLGAVGNCGMVACCRRFMRKFNPVTIKMAKEQNLFLNPTKISGICGRLLCCLSFEEENYQIFYKRCPRIGKRMDTDQGLLKVMRANFFRNSVTAYTDRGEELEFTLDEWEALNPRRFDPNIPRPEPAPSSEPKRPPRRGGRPGSPRDGGRPKLGRGPRPQPEKSPAEGDTQPPADSAPREATPEQAPASKDRSETDGPASERKPRKRKRRRRPRRAKKED